MISILFSYFDLDYFSKFIITISHFDFFVALWTSSNHDLTLRKKLITPFFFFFLEPYFYITTWCCHSWEEPMVFPETTRVGFFFCIGHKPTNSTNRNTPSVPWRKSKFDFYFSVKSEFFEIPKMKAHLSFRTFEIVQLLKSFSIFD